MGWALVPVIEDLENFNYLWNTSDWLNSTAVDTNILVNREVLLRR